jgi:hypothetical protein
MTVCSLSISLYLSEDEDGLARYLIQAANDRFSCATTVWGYAETLAELATAINGFPTSPSAKESFQLGSLGVGQCQLEFSCIDGSGHAVVWVTVIEETPVYPTSLHQTTTLCLRIEATAIDSFIGALQSLSLGSSNNAVLYGSPP